MRLRPTMGPELALRLAMSASGPTLDILFGRPDPWPTDVPDTTPASYPPGYQGPRR